MRWLIGDVQGCARELDDVLRTIRFDPTRDELWCLGDLVNRGPESLEALRLWRDVGGRALLGNHDIHALLVRSGRKKRVLPSLAALFTAPDCDELLERLRASPVLVHLPSAGLGPEVWIVHAGLHPAWSDLPAVAERLSAGAHDDDWLIRAEVVFATNVRCCTAAGERSSDTGPPESCRSPFAPWDRWYGGDALVVHGHWATRGYHRTGRVMGLDSGCVYGGPLTAWCQEDDRVVQVPSRAK